MSKLESKVMEDLVSCCISLGMYLKRKSTTGNITGGGVTPNKDRGDTDYYGCYEGYFIAIETKREVGGKYSPRQILERQRILNSGGLWFGIHNSDDIQNFETTLKSLKNRVRDSNGSTKPHSDKQPSRRRSTSTD
jgi:hypothetical protein